MKMKITVSVLFGITAVALAGFVIYRIRRRNTGMMLSQVSEEGYETAHDVLFPGNSNRGSNLRFGPVLPQ